MDLKDKTAFITGGAQRLGRYLAIHLSEAGCRLIVHYRQSRGAAESLRSQTGCKLFHADFATLQIDDLRKRLQEEVGAVDILINNASSFRSVDWSDVTEEVWNHEMAVNLKAPFFLAQHFGVQMKERGLGKILNMVDIAAQRPYLRYLPYSIAKAGVVSWTQALGRALAPEVQVNAIAPGTILFPEQFTEAAKSRIVKKIPAGRTATIDEFLRTVDFLLAGVDYITGQTILLDGGRTLTW